MEELLIILASAQEEDKILNDLKESITDYQCNPSDNNLGSLSMNVMLLAIKLRLKGTKNNAIDEINEWKKAKDAHIVGSKILGNDKTS